MTAIANMAPRVLISIPDCPQPSVEAYLLLAATELIRKSKVWSEVLPAVSLISTGFPYVITPPAGAKVIKVLSVVVDGLAPPLEETNVRTEELLNTDWRTVAGIAARYLELPRGTVTAIPLPELAQSFVFTVAYEPAETATAIPDAIYDEYREAIISGAIYLLSVIPNRPWSNPDLGAFHKRIFDAGIEDASIGFQQHFTLPSMNTAPSPI